MHTYTHSYVLRDVDFVREWLDTINSLPPNLRFVQPSEMAKELVPKLREQGADMIIALTHMV